MSKTTSYDELEKRYIELLYQCSPNQKLIHDKLQSAFLDFFSYEVRTHMNSIVGFADLLGNKNISEKQRNDFISNIFKSGNILLNIIDDNISLAKIKVNEIEVFNTRFDLNSLIDETYNEFMNIDYKRQREKVSLNPYKESNKEFHILSDKLILKTIFTHLINNAVKYTFYGTIEFGYRITDDVMLECFVSDSGLGILNKKLQGIKQFLNRDNNRTADEFGIKGLGLTIVKGFLELINGEIIVESEQGIGTNVFFTVPLELS